MIRRWGLWVLLALAALAAVAWRFAPAGSELLQSLREAGRERPPGQASITYLLEGTEALRFALPTGGGRLRLLTNALVPELQTHNPGQRWNYALEYTLLDASGRVLERRPYHHRAWVVRLREEGRGQTYVPYSMEGGQLTPLVTRPLVVNLHGLDGAAELQVRRVPEAGAPDQLLLRLYHEERIAEAELATAWQRTGLEERNRLARGLVYPADLLRSHEQQALVRSRWLPLGPAGVAERDYRQRLLYLADTEDAVDADIDVAGAGMQFGHGWRATAPIPEHGGMLEVQIEPLLTEPGAGQPGTLEFLWYGRGPHARGSTKVAWDGNALSHFQPVKGGLYELASDTPARARLWLEHAGQRVEITPPLQTVRTYLPDPEHPVRYRLEQVPGEFTALRLDLRAVTPATAVDVSYRMLDAQGDTIDAGALLLEQPPSEHDRLGTWEGVRAVSSSLSRYLALPPAARTLELRGNGLTTVLAYTRPAGLQRVIRVPEEYYASGNDEARGRTWFLIQPDNARELLVAGRSELLQTRDRPPETDEALRRGEYRWEELRPTGAWRARELLVARDPDQLLRREALATSYRPLPVGTPLSIDFQSPVTIGEVRPALAYVKPDESPMTLQLRLDGRPWHRASVSARHGELRLPPIATGRRVLQLDAPGEVQAHISHGGDAEAALVRRSAFVLTPEGLSVPISKTGRDREVISLRLYAPHGSDERTRVRLMLDAPAPSVGRLREDWTLAERIYDLRPAAGHPTPVLASGGRRVDSGQPFSFSLGADLPPGDYRLHIKRVSGPADLLAVTRITPGLYADHRLIWETLPDD